MRWLDSITNSTDMSLRKFLETVNDRGAWHVTVYGVTKSRVQLSYRTTKSYPHYTDLTNQNTAMSGPWQLV